MMKNKHSLSANCSTPKKNCPIVHGYPLVGILPNLIIDNPLNFLQRITKTYPNEIIELKTGIKKTYLITNPDHVKHVLKDNWKNYGKGRLMWDAVRLILGDSIVTNDGESWFRSRRLMQPIFTANQVNFLTELIVEIISDALVDLDKVSKAEVIDMDKEMMILGQRVLLGTIFGSGLDRSEARIIADSLDSAARAVRLQVFLSFLPKWFFFPGRKTLQNSLQIINSKIFSIVSQRRKSEEKHNDLLDRLLAARDAETKTGMDDKQLRNECVTVFLAGFGTAAKALTWLWYMLDRHPEIEDKLRQEIYHVLGKRKPTSADLTKLKYTKMVVQEALRQHPTTWIVPRVAIEKDTISGYPIDAGASILLSPYLTNHLPQFWKQPKAFDPDRFDPEKSTQNHPFAQFTFGGGPRACIGKHLALVQMQLIVIMIVQKYRPRCVPGHPVEIIPGLDLHLRDGLKMTLEKV